jgi:hypothetical protein
MNWYHICFFQPNKSITMTTDYNLEFLRKKLALVNNALMCYMGNSTGALPNDIIALKRIDGEGRLWFGVHLPKKWVSTSTEYFPLRLLFYKKGVDFYIEVSGVAALAKTEEAEATEVSAEEGMVLLQMTPSLIEYTETARKKLTSFNTWVRTLITGRNAKKYFAREGASLTLMH